MHVRVLGSAAGGGFPQWNCACPCCSEARSGRGRASPRTQDSVAVSADGDAWFLLNASPDILTQINRTFPLQPRSVRRSPIRAVALSNGDIDHILGLFSLRESHPFVLYSTPAVRRGLAERNAIFRTLERSPDQIIHKPLELGRPAPLTGPDGEETGLTLTALPAPGKLPIHLAADSRPSLEDNVGLLITDERRGQTLAYFSSTSALAPIQPYLRGASAVLFDGTFWSSDELPRLGISTARAEDMAHLPVGGPLGSLAALSESGVRALTFTHINNTNPMLLEGSPERLLVERAGFRVAYDGMVVDL